MMEADRGFLNKLVVDPLVDELIRLILSGEVESIKILGESEDSKILEPLTDAEEIIKAMGFRPNILIEHNELTDILSWSVQSIRPDPKGG
ncbi:MAG: hypothetical protein ACM3TR_06115 [Caulobacteraceae bacterium]